MLKLISHYGRIYVITSQEQIKAVAKAIARDPKLDYFKQRALETLDKAKEREMRLMRKAFFSSFESIQKARAFPVGTVHKWGEREYIKIA